MERMIYLDTHAVVWLYEGRAELFSRAARHAIESNECRVSPAVELELQFLREIKRLLVAPSELLRALESELSIFVCEAPFRSIVSGALELYWTRDPFDRLIVGHAASQKKPLVTKDAKIRRHYDMAVW